MAGIYIHIPYCRQACSYCNFHFSTNLKNKKELLSSLHKEIELQKNFFSSNEILTTLYIGGGTPSILEISELENILAAIDKHYNIDKQAEFTIELNPDDITIDYASNLFRMGFNRVSLGVQSFVENDLQYMNRIHSSKDSLKSIEILQQAGFENISCDLIYGSPTLSDEDWIKNLDILIEKNIPHLSCYALTVEPKTILNKKIKEKKAAAPHEETMRRHFLILVEKLNKAGYIHYEISNFGKEGYFSKHNQSYWNGEKYLGLGPGAHSYDGNNRQWNVAGNEKYIQSLEKGIIPVEKEILTEEDLYNEFVMIKLRLKDGIDLVDLLTKFGEERLTHFNQNISPWMASGHVLMMSKSCYLSTEGKLMADGIAASLFV